MTSSSGGRRGARTLARQRHDSIMEEIHRHGAVRVADIAVQLGVSDMTVRRDLEVLHESGLVEKVHGGAASPANRNADEPGFAAKSLRNTPEKRAIASVAATLVRPGTAIGITAGTTTFQLAAALTEIPDLIVVTNSIPVAEAFHQAPRPDRTVILSGGVRTPSNALVGPVAIGALRTLHFDAVFMGVHGMNVRAGFTTPNLLEAETNRAFADATERLIVLADHTKWDVTGLSSMAALDEAATVVTDDGIATDARTALEEHVRSVLLADLQAPHVVPLATRRSS